MRQVIRCRKRGRKGGKLRAKRGDPAEQATMANASEGVKRRCQAHPAYVGYCPQGRGRPKYAHDANIVKSCMKAAAISGDSIGFDVSFAARRIMSIVRRLLLPRRPPATMSGL